MAFFNDEEVREIIYHQTLGTYVHSEEEHFPLNAGFQQDGGSSLTTSPVRHFPNYRF